MTVLSVEAAGFVVMALLVVAVLGILWLLGVRDWRCYGLALLWPPVISAIQTGNVTIPLALGAALVWRFRDDARAAGASLGLTLAAKLFLWPLVLWLAFTRRIAAAVLAPGGRRRRGARLVGGDRLRRASASIPDLLSRVQELEEEHGLHRCTRWLSTSAPSESVARALWAGLRSRCSPASPSSHAAATSDERSSSRSPPRSRARRSSGSTTSRCCWSPSPSPSLGWVRRGSSRWRCTAPPAPSTGRPLQNALTIAAAALTVAVALRPVAARASGSARAYVAGRRTTVTRGSL